MVLTLAREAGLEPATSKLTASCSTIELLPNIHLHILNVYVVTVNIIGIFFIDYSCLNESIGSLRDARRAGIEPNNIPAKVAAPIEINIICQFTAGLKSVK